MAWDNGVSAPGGASYSAPLLSFQQFSNWAADDPYQKVRDEQAKKLNEQRIQAGQQQQDIAKTFQGGLPRNADGSVDYASAVAMLAKKGDVGALWNGADAMAIQGASKLSPMLANGGQPQGQGAPSSIPAKPLGPVSANSPQGDAGQGTIASIVTDRLPNQDATTGQTIAKVAQVMGLDPNANLTAGQIRRAQGLVQKYAASSSPTSDANAGTLPPSANAGTPAPPASSAAAPSAPSSFNDRFASAGGGAPQAAPPAAAPQAAPGGAPAQSQPPQPQAPQPQGQPLTPQVPLPKGFNDPQQAMLALRAEAARLAANPRMKGQVDQLNGWADRIENSLKPIEMGAGRVLLDPKDGHPIYQGNQPSLDASAIHNAAENYITTGKLPPNLGRGVQGTANSDAIQREAAQLITERGIDPGTLPQKWQSFGAQATGMRVLETRAAGLTLAENEASSLIPRVREISGKVSRTKYPTLNSLILASQKGSGGTDVIKLGIAIESLVPVYARVLKPVGQVGQGDMARAHDILDKAWSDGQINAALDQMDVELASARKALDKTMKDAAAGRGAGENNRDNESGKASSGKPTKDGWTVHTLPDGSKARVQEVN